jgi:DTW domain-containing protein YfiP
MSTRRENQSKRCMKCRVHLDNCYCHQIKPFNLNTKISLILNKKERFLTSNTAFLTQNSLSNCEIFIRGLENTPLPIEHVRPIGFQPLYLFPSDDAQVLSPEYLASFKLPVNLIVPDGTWRQAKKMHTREEILRDIPRVKIGHTESSIYPLRRQVYDFGLCTHEAIAYALGEIEGPEVKEKLIENLKIMVDAHTKYRAIFEKP